MKKIFSSAFFFRWVVSITLCSTFVPRADATHRPNQKTDLVVIMMMDGTRRENAYGQRGARKDFLEQLIRSGIAFAGQAVYPTNTATNFASLTTGSYPERHGVLSEKEFVDDQFNPVAIAPQHVAVTSIFEVLEAHSLRGVFLSAKTYDANGVRGAKRAIVVDGKKLVKDEKSVLEKARYNKRLGPQDFPNGFSYGWAEEIQRMPENPEMLSQANRIKLTQFLIRRGLEVLQSDPQKEDIALIIANFAATDWAGHAWGPDHPYYDQAIVEMDRGMEYFFGELRKVFEGKRITLVVSADHGFSKTEKPKLRLQKSDAEPESPIFDELFDEIIVRPVGCGSSCVSFFIKEPDQYRAAFERLLTVREQEWGWVDRIYTSLGYPEEDGSIQRLRAYFPDRAPEFFVDLRSPWALTVFGHGTAAPENVNIPLILSGAGIRVTKKVRQSASIVDIAPTTLALLGIASPNEWQGKVLSKALEK